MPHYSLVGTSFMVNIHEISWENRLVGDVTQQLLHYNAMGSEHVVNGVIPFETRPT